MLEVVHAFISTRALEVEVMFASWRIVVQHNFFFYKYMFSLYLS